MSPAPAEGLSFIMRLRRAFIRIAGDMWTRHFGPVIAEWGCVDSGQDTPAIGSGRQFCQRTDGVARHTIRRLICRATRSFRPTHTRLGHASKVGDWGVHATGILEHPTTISARGELAIDVMPRLLLMTGGGGA